MESWEMKGFTVDCKYIVKVKDLMEKAKLPTPWKKRYLQGDGEILPIVLYTVKGWDV